MRQVSSERELTWPSNRQLAPLWCHYSLHIPLGESVVKIRTGNTKVFNLCADIFMQGRQVSSLVDFCSLSHLLLLHPLWNWPRIDIDPDQAMIDMESGIAMQWTWMMLCMLSKKLGMFRMCSAFGFIGQAVCSMNHSYLGVWVFQTSIIVISFFMMEMLKRVRWLALAPFMSVMITIPLMSNWSVHLCRGIS